jgi:hypothetical protein
VVVAALEKDGNGDWQDVSSVVTWKRLDDKKFSTINSETVWTKTTSNL